MADRGRRQAPVAAAASDAGREPVARSLGCFRGSDTHRRPTGVIGPRTEVPTAKPVRRHLNRPHVSLAWVYIKDVKHGHIRQHCRTGPDVPKLLAVPVSAHRGWDPLGTRARGPERRRVRPLRLRHHAKINLRSMSNSRQASLR